MQKRLIVYVVEYWCTLAKSQFTSWKGETGTEQLNVLAADCWQAIRFVRSYVMAAGYKGPEESIHISDVHVSQCCKGMHVDVCLTEEMAGALLECGPEERTCAECGSMGRVLRADFPGEYLCVRCRK